jgi:hypothetical protein
MTLPAKKNIFMNECYTDAEHEHDIDEGVLQEDDD